MIVRAPLALVLVAFALLGCGSKAPSQPPTNPPPRPLPSAGSAAPPADPIAAATSFTTFTSARFNLAVPIPDGASFRVDDRTERWLVATHEATSSLLLVRTWREDAVVNRARCEERARTWRDLPVRASSRLLEARRVPVPADHDTVAEVRLGLGRSPAEGFVLAFGGWAKRCFAYVFVTRDADPRVVTARLATLMDGSLARIRIESELAPVRPVREPLP